jgi:glycerol-3-phosphate dehydrogenase (NAD(P)+)
LCAVMSSAFKNIGIIGSGSWATALVKIVSEQEDINLSWWIRSEESLEYLKKFGRNPRYLSSVDIDTQKVNLLSNLNEILRVSDLLILAVPSAFLNETLKHVELPVNKVYVSAIKGVDPESRQVIVRYLEKQYHIPSSQIGLISGPCHAEEVALEKLSYLTIAAESEELAKKIETLISCRYINTTTNADLYGAEYAAVLKNIYAIGAGIAHGLGYGDNFQAIYTGAAIREMEIFLDALHENHRDVKNAAYLGDLLVTCYSQFSRNRTFGNMLGKGYSVKSAQLEMNMIAEGYYATESIYLICKENKLDTPIIESVYDVLYRSSIPSKTFQKLAFQLA